MKKTLLSLFCLVSAMATAAQTADMTLAVSKQLSVHHTAMPVALQLQSTAGPALRMEARGLDTPWPLDSRRRR